MLAEMFGLGKKDNDTVRISRKSLRRLCKKNAEHDLCLGEFNTPGKPPGEIPKPETNGPLSRIRSYGPCLDEKVNHPPHYNFGKIEVIEVIEDWKLGFNDGNVVKYVGRAPHKGKELEDLEKAEFYLKRHINNIKEKLKKPNGGK